MCACVAGYNNMEVAEFLLERGADVNMQDKGGLIPLHNAASYGVSVVLGKRDGNSSVTLYFFMDANYSIVDNKS